MLPLEEGNKHSCPSRFRAKSTRAKRKRKRVGGNKEERERKKERQRLVVVVLVRRKRRSILFDGKKKKKKKWNKIVSAIGILAVGKTYLSDLSIGCVYCVRRDRESRERGRKTDTEYEKVRSL